jgi:integrase
LRLRWRDVGERSMTFRVTKSRTRRMRAARLMAPVRADLTAWRLACGPPIEDALVFPRRDGQPWTEDDWRNWRTRRVKPALEAARLAATIRPYDLRHAAASLWLHEGRSVVELAQWLGHAPSMTLDTYGHVMVELSDGERRSAEAEIRAARDELARPWCLGPRSDSRSGTNFGRWNSPVPRRE